MRSAYRIFSHAIAPLLPVWLELRRMKGKEDGARMHERFGHASLKRPAGTVVWLHAASVGEANSVLYLVHELLKHFPGLHVLLTTGTVTSARLMQSRLPKRAFHQFSPVDTPAATERFMRHWRPDVALWVESELWPNLIAAANRWQCYMCIVNGRMSEKSFRMWNRFPALIYSMLNAFDAIFTQSKKDTEHFHELGANEIHAIGNLKYDAPALSCDEALLLALKKEIGNRPVWLAASTHPGEEEQIETAYAITAAMHKNLLTIIVPRHPSRGSQIAEKLSRKYRVAQRSKQELLMPETQFYIADTLGELGLFYRLCDVVFMGGSLVRHGGQNPLEPARLFSAILTGEHTHNFSAIYDDMIAQKAAIRVKNPTDLAAQVTSLLSNPARKNELQQQAKEWVDDKGGATARLMDALYPVFQHRKGAV